MTLVELIVAIAIFTVVMSVFMAGVVTMTNGTVRSQVTADAGDSVRTIFQKLDKQVRYADAINLPGIGVGGATYVEFRVPADASSTGVTTCAQWRWDPVTRLLQMRTWADGVAPGTSFRIMAKDVVANSAVTKYPFEVTLATAQRPRETLTLHLLLKPKAQNAEVSTESEFVARNSTVDSLGNADTNTNGVSDMPACIAGTRP